MLKEYLTKGYAVDKRKLQQQSRQLEELRQTVKPLDSVMDLGDLHSNEAPGLLRVLTDYIFALNVLDRYDDQVLEIGDTTLVEPFRITYPEVLRTIQGLKEKFGGSTLLDRERTSPARAPWPLSAKPFPGRELYPGVEEKAAHLLYFVTTLFPMATSA